MVNAMKSQRRHPEGRRIYTNRSKIITISRLLPQPEIALARGFDLNTIAFVALFVDFDLVMRKVQTIQSLLQGQGFTTPFHSYGLRAPNQAEEAKLVSEVTGGRPRAIICCGQCSSAQSWRALERYLSEGGHVVFFDQPCEEPFDHVLFDRAHNTYEATRYLLKLGHREIGFWMTDESQGPRLEGFERAMCEWDVSVRRDWLFGGGPGRYLYNEDSGIEFAQKFLSLTHKPTAMCMVNDSATHAFVAALSRAGVRVPQDVSVVSHDDTPIARCGFLPLTTMSHPIASIGHAVVDLLQERMSGELDASAQQVVVRGELIVRQSTAFGMQG